VKINKQTNGLSNCTHLSAIIIQHGQQAVQNCKSTRLGKLFSPTYIVHLSGLPYESILSYILIQPLYKKRMERSFLNLVNRTGQ